MYQGEERRKNMDNEIQDIKVELASFTASVTEWMKTTTEYRKNLCDKIEVVKTRLSELPCKERRLGTKLVWGAIGITFGILIAHLGWK